MGTKALNPTTDAGMTITEVRRFEALDARVVKGVQTFVEVGKALAEIRDSRLYRKDYATFEDYCADRDISRPRAYQLMSAAGIAEDLSTRVDTPPTTEKQIRPLSRLEPDERGEAWSEAVATAPNGKVTAKHVEEVVARRMEPNDPDAEPERDWTVPEGFERAPSTATTTKRPKQNPPPESPARAAVRLMDRLGKLVADPAPSIPSLREAYNEARAAVLRAIANT